jgi:hypothetical protein
MEPKLPPASSKGKKRNSNKSHIKLSLSDLPANYAFNRDSLMEILNQDVNDKDWNSIDRPLKPTHVLVMALNEIASEQGYGYFFHLRGNHCWFNLALPVTVCPESRAVSPPM